MSRKAGERLRKLFSIDKQLLEALYEYSRDSGARLDDLYDEALRDLMKKKGQPVTLDEALHQSTKLIAANDPVSKSSTKGKRLPKRPRR